MDPAAGVSPGTKDRFEIASKTVAILGGIISAIALVVALNGTTRQRATEQRWNEAKLGMELSDGMLNDPQAFDALRMVDWNARTYDIGHRQQVLIDTVIVRRALDVGSNASLPVADIYVRESFDRLFHPLGKIERAMRSGLVEIGDVASPIDYYTPILLSRYGGVLIPYMRQLGYCDAMNLLHRFDPRRAPACRPPTPAGPGPGADERRAEAN